MKNILFVCDFNSVHSRSLITAIKDNNDFNLTILSSSSAKEMDGVNLIILNNDNQISKKKVEIIANLIQTISPKLYRYIISFVLARQTKRLIEKAEKITFKEKFDMIHALRTQPEGIIANALVKKLKAKFYLTIWGQDFVLWAKHNSWLKQQTLKTIESTFYVFPDNLRDNRIIKEDYGFKHQKTLVLPATGGLDLDYLNNLELTELPDIKGELNFLSVRGYDNSYVKIKKLLHVFKRISKDYPTAHFYIDVHQKHNKVKDKKMHDWIKKEKLESQVTILHLTRQELFGYMSKCKFHVSATRTDGFPLSLLEGVYFGQTPIVFNHESTRVLENEFEYYYSFNSFKIEEIENAWRKAISESRVKQADIKITNQIKIVEKYERNKNITKIVEKYYHE